MTRKLIATLMCGAFIAGCTTDPFTGQPKVSNTAGGAAIGKSCTECHENYRA